MNTAVPGMAALPVEAIISLIASYDYGNGRSSLYERENRGRILMENKKFVRKKIITKKHIVVFQDSEDQVISTVFVEDGASVIAPDMDEVLKEKEHHKIVFSGWDKNLSEVHSNLIVHPIYQEIPKEYLIMYFHENGKILGTETVAYGGMAKADVHPVKKETKEFIYSFEGWSCPLDFIDGDRMAKARFREERKRFPVRFFDEAGHLLKEELVYYGQSAVAPESVKKEEDETFIYHFDFWDSDYSCITKPLEVSAVFRSEFKEYLVRFFEEGRQIGQTSYHYNEDIEYPVLSKKGYDFIWNSPDQKVHKSADFFGHWQYAHPRGKKFETDEGIFEIVAPSTIHGSARCLEYHSLKKEIVLPEKIKLGDYYYSLSYLHKNAFCFCENVESIICSDQLKHLERRCFASNKKLRKIVIGKNVLTMEGEIFADSKHLRQIILKGDKLKHISKNSFDRMNHRVEFVVNPSRERYYKNILSVPIRQKELILKTWNR